MRFPAFLAAWMVLTAATGSALAQVAEAAGAAEEPDERPAQQWRVGMVVTATGAPCGGIVGTVTVPTEWPEQKVRVVKEDITRGVRVRYQMVQEAARQMTVTIPRLAAGQEAKAVITFELKMGWPPPAADTSGYVLPDPKKLDRKLRPYLRPSPLIESDDPQIKALAEEIGVKEASAWARVEAIYDWVRQKVKYDKDSPLKGALAALRDGTGDCDELTSLFVAICRAGNIPARTVRVPGHCYPEFYLVDGKGQGRWFPCEAAGTRSFGQMRVPKPILQKGDNIRMRNAQTRRAEDYRFLPETLVVKSFRPGGEPKLKLVCERVAE